MRNISLRLSRTLACLALLLACGAAFNVDAQTPDPGAAGPLAVTREEYDYGNLAFQPTGFPSAVEVKASIHHPTDLTGGPFPVVVFLHGRHVTCYNKAGVTALRWPCRSTETVIPS